MTVTVGGTEQRVRTAVLPELAATGRAPRPPPPPAHAVHSPCTAPVTATGSQSADGEPGPQTREGPTEASSTTQNRPWATHLRSSSSPRSRGGLRPEQSRRWCKTRDLPSEVVGPPSPPARFTGRRPRRKGRHRHLQPPDSQAPSTSVRPGRGGRNEPAEHSDSSRAQGHRRECVLPAVRPWLPGDTAAAD